MSRLLDHLQAFWGKNNQAYVRLIIINIAFSAAVGIMYLLTKGNINFVMVPDNFVALLKQPFSLVTYMFAHHGLFHLLGNLIIIFFVGRIFEDLLGAQKLYLTYFLAGIVGALSFIFIVSAKSFLIGASGAAMGMLYGLTVCSPNYEFFLYGLVKLKLWWITAAYFAMDLLMVLVNHNAAGGKICHLFGGLTGAFLMLYWSGKMPAIFNNGPKKNTFGYKININRDLKQNQINHNKPDLNNVPTQEEIDLILDKINERGYNNLTQQEKETLFRAKDIEV